jgi:hypothetical protein
MQIQCHNQPVGRLTRPQDRHICTPLTCGSQMLTEKKKKKEKKEEIEKSQEKSEDRG